jgi:signal transduction histidine kinase
MVEKTAGMRILQPDAPDFLTGPAVGEPFPDFTLRDPAGECVNLTKIRNGRPAMVHFFRSVLWCGFCSIQLVELQHSYAEYEREGIPVFAICPEPPDLTKTFANQHGIRYYLLSDEGGSYIRRVGVLNTAVPEDDPVYGIPHPGSFLIQRDGRVFEKRFHSDIRVREPMGSLLLYFKLKELNENLEQRVIDRTRELEEAQVKLVETARLATLGKLVAAINHELNTPVGALSSSLNAIWQFYDRTCKALPASQQTALSELKKTIDDACTRISSLAADLRHFVRLDSGEIEQIDLRNSLDLVADMLRWKGEFEVVRAYGPIEPWIGRAPQLHQALLEIITNAVEAMNGEGTLNLSACQDNGHIVLTVRDSGRGIPADQMNSLFEPHLRAKNGRVGMSLGLTLAHKIIHEAGGDLNISSIEGAGTTVRIRLPRSWGAIA